MRDKKILRERGALLKEEGDAVREYYKAVHEENLESCGGFSWVNLLEKPEDWSDFEPETQVEVCVVPDVIDVLLVSPSSVVTDFCDGFFVLL